LLPLFSFLAYQSLFQEKDYRNSRFFYKRAFYTACLAASFVQSSFNLDVKYEAAEGDVRRTTLLLTPRKGALRIAATPPSLFSPARIPDGSEHDFHKLHAAIRIIPVLADDAPIPTHRLAPAQPNIRGAPAPAPVTPLTLAPSSTLTTAPAPPAEETQPPTPQYNNTIALVLARASRTRLVGAHRLAGAAPSFGDGLALLRVWANQRGFGAGAGCSDGEAQGNGAGSARNYCVRGFEGLGAWWACVLEVLIFGEEPIGETGKAKNRYKRPLVGKGLSSYQLFRAALDFLGGCSAYLVCIRALG
jgi:U3 small nucleolar RNA-associated protein 22